MIWKNGTIANRKILKPDWEQSYELNHIFPLINSTIFSYNSYYRVQLKIQSYEASDLRFQRHLSFSSMNKNSTLGFNLYFHDDIL